MQAQVEVESGVEKDVQVVRMRDQMITEAQVPIPPVDTPVLNALEAGGPSVPGFINNL